MAQNLIFKAVALDSVDYEEVKKLRSRVLREPLGRTLSAEDLLSDRGNLIVAGSIAQIIVACALIKEVTDQTWKMRQVAVDFEFQGRGLGRSLVVDIEQRVELLGATEIVLNARETAVPFYLKLGYRVVSDEFSEVGLSHFKMCKSLRVEVR